VYYEANEGYYRGCPKTVFVQLKEIGDQTEWQKLQDLAAEEYDMVDMPATQEAVEQVRQTNSNKKIIGKTYGCKIYDGDAYTYIGINAENVCVNQKSDSTRSKNLRQALAVLFAACREEVVELKETGACVIDYPASRVSWNVLQEEEKEYQEAYAKDINGKAIYKSSMDLQQRSDAACRAALEYLKAAGFKTKNGKVRKAPEGTSLRYVIYVPVSAADSGISLLVKNTKKMFRQIGLKLVVVDTWSSQKIEKKLSQGKGQIWCGWEDTSAQGDLYGMYHSVSAKDKTAGAKNYFQIKDSDLDDYIEETRKTADIKKSIDLYQQCFEKIFEWAVEVPVYQERNMTVFGTGRVNYKSLPENTSPYYDWYQEIEKLEML
jgi:peptide/nickel transport system substrate-binding protein